MIAVFINNCYRIWENKGRVLVMMGLIFGAVSVAVYISNNEQTITRIGIVGEEGAQSFENDGLKVTYLDEAPPLSQLVMGTYDAIIEKDGTNFTIQTIKSEAYREQLEAFLLGSHEEASFIQGNQGVGSKIIGFLLMFLLMSSVTNMFIFSEDKEKHLLERVAAAPIAFTRMLTAYSLFSFLLLFIPTTLIIYGIKLVAGVAIGFTFGEYVLLLGIICLFATAFSLCNAALFYGSDQANMIGSMVVVITTLLSGSFFSLEVQNRWLDSLIQLSPQKKYLDIVIGIEEGKSAFALLSPIAYVFAFTLLLFIVAVVKTRKDYVRN